MPTLPRRITLALLACTASTAAAQVAEVPGTLLIVNKGPSTLSIVDVATGATLATLPTGQGPHEVALSSDRRTAVVTNYAGPGANTLTVIDVPARRVARTIDLGENRRPHGIDFLPGDSLVVVTSETARTIVIANVAEGRVVRTLATGAPGSHMVARTGDGTLAYTANMGSHTVTELSLTRNASRQWPVPQTPEAINVVPDGSEVWVGSNGRGEVAVLSPATGNVETAATGLSWPYRIAFTPDLSRVLVPDLRQEELRILDRRTRRELARLSFPGGAPQGITITPDGRHAFLSLNGQARVAVIDIARGTVIGHVPAGDTPDGIAFVPAGIGVEKDRR